MIKLVWQKIKWDKINRKMNRLQLRIYNYSKKNNKRKIKYFQTYLIKNFDFKLLAVKNSIFYNKKKKYYLTPLFFLYNNKKIKNSNKVIKKLINKKKPKKNKISISKLVDNAKQYLIFFALQPEWEAKFETSAYGYRPGRNIHDVIKLIKNYIQNNSNKKYFILQGNLLSFLNEFDYSLLITKLNTITIIEKQLLIWLKTNLIDFDNFCLALTKNKKDGFFFSINIRHELIPLKNILTPFFLNIMIQGLENYLKSKLNKQIKFKSMCLVSYTNNFIFIHQNFETLKYLQFELQNWLRLTLNLEIKAELLPINTCTQGFNFLGFRFINLLQLNKLKLKIYPEKNAIKSLIKTIGFISRTNRAISSYEFIKKLKPIIIAWVNYYELINYKKSFSRLNHSVFQILRAWVFRRDPRHGRNKIKEKYFPSGNTYFYDGKTYNDNWTLVGKIKDSKNNTKTNFLPKFTWIKKKKYIKINPKISIYSNNSKYWINRIIYSDNLNLLKKELTTIQKGKCPWCFLHIFLDQFDDLSIYFILPFYLEGSKNIYNLQLFHKQCLNEKKKFSSI